jgi:hypothetical protein
MIFTAIPRYNLCSSETTTHISEVGYVQLYSHHYLLFYFGSVGNKIDREDAREIPTHIGQQFAERYEMNFTETSAKEADNVDKLFLDIAIKLTEDARNRGRLAPGESPVDISTNTKTINSCSKCLKF